MSGDVLLNGMLAGRLPGRKEFSLYYLELTASEFHIFDGQEDSRKHIQGIRIDRSDTAGVETRVRKGELRFYLNRPGDGKYIFKVNSEAVREQWIGRLQRVITKDGLEKIDGFQTPSTNAFNPENVGSKVVLPTRVDAPSVPKSRMPTDSRTLPGRGRMATGNSTSVLKTSLPPPPAPVSPGTGVNSPRASIISTDSGIGTSVGGEVHRPSHRKSGSNSMPNSGSGMFERGSEGSSSGSSPHSADAEFRHRVTVSSEDQPKWFWGTMNRQDCEDMLKVKGEIGNFVVRVNATGHHIMSFWRVDGVHHHKILTHEGIWRFEKAAVSAEGESLADLLDTYMKTCTKDKNIKPFGGGLFDNYTYAWTPQDFDMDLLGKKLKQQKELREKAAKKPRKKQEYTPVEVDTGLDDERGGFENDPEPGEETTIKMKPKNKPLPLPPTKSFSGASKSPKPSHGIKQHSSFKLASGDSGIANRPPLGGSALMQELAMKKGLKSATLKAAGSRNVSSPSTQKQKENKVLPSPPTTAKVPSTLPTTSAQEGEECEPVYANTADHKEVASYQNCDFDGPPAAAGPPGATPTSSGVVTAAGGGQSEYQNINFGVQKAPETKKKPKASTARSPHAHVAGKNHTHSNAGHTHPNTTNTNGSVAGNSAGEYQNIQFGVKKK